MRCFNEKEVVGACDKGKNQEKQENCSDDTAPKQELRAETCSSCQSTEATLGLEAGMSEQKPGTQRQLRIWKPDQTVAMF